MQRSSVPVFSLDHTPAVSICEKDKGLPTRSAVAEMGIFFDGDGEMAVMWHVTHVTGLGVAQNPYISILLAVDQFV